MLDEVPYLLSDDLSWQRDALCAEPSYNPDDWFESGRHAVDRAKRVCMRCAVLRECLAYAIDSEITEGLWGATTPAERAQLVAAGVTAGAVLQWGAGAIAGLRVMRGRELDAQVAAIRWGRT